MGLKFTQEVKDKWLENLKSGKYIQGYTALHNPRQNTFCCIGVLGDCIEELDNAAGEVNDNPKNPYEFLTGNNIDVKSIWRLNDSDELDKDSKQDYSNVIPLIESLEVVE